MASSRTINAPGVELHEIDRSGYTLQDNSLPNAPAVLITGFAKKGINCVPQWVNSMSTFIELFGEPDTEEEKYFYYACKDIIDRGGICIACKLPYRNDEYQKYRQFGYKLLPQQVSINNSDISDVNKIDSYLTSYAEISSMSDDAILSYITEGIYDNYKIGNVGVQQNTIKIVDINKTRLQTTNFNSISSIDGFTNDCLGIFPVLITPVNAIYQQNLLATVSGLSDNDIKSKRPVYNALSTVGVNTPILTDNVKILDGFSQLLDENSIIKFSSNDDDFSRISLNDIAGSMFPQIQFTDKHHIDPTYLKFITIVVIKAFKDSSNNNKVNYTVLESFTGSLDKYVKSETTKSTLFIDDIVNTNSKYINVFSNISSSTLKKISTLRIKDQTTKMLGFFEAECAKKIDVDLLVSALTNILDTCKDPNTLPLDIVVDAGVSNIAQLYDILNRLPEEERDNFIWRLNKYSPQDEQTKKWSLIIKKFNDFCQYTRKDCMFIADGLRPFCLEGKEKLVRKTKIGSSIENDIVPLIRQISGVNSSYAAGYCDWFQIIDEFTTILMWLPPSIKAASIYVYCDTYFHTWDAPAGMNRGRVPGVVDIAFNPTIDDAGKIYNQTWNYAMSYPIDGIIMEGQKTFQSKKTALDRVNVRRLLLSLEKNVIRVAKRFLYEGNTAYLRQKFVDTIQPIFEKARDGAGIIDYAIKCDDELNTADVIDNHELRCKIAIKPVKTIEFIVIDLICTNQIANVSEEVMR